VAVRATATPPDLHRLWQAPAESEGPPIVAGGLVWTIDQGGTLSAIDPATGTVNQQFTIGAEANHFPTPSVGDGLLLAPSADQVHAFAGRVPTGSSTSMTPAATTAPATTRPPGRNASPTTPAPTGRATGSSRWWVALVVLVVVAVLAGGWLGGRARRRRPGR